MLTFGSELGQWSSRRALASAFKFVQVSTGKSAASISRIREWAGSVNHTIGKHTPIRLKEENYRELRKHILRRDGWRCQLCGSMTNLEVHHKQFRSHSGEDDEQNLITLCFNCHSSAHGQDVGPKSGDPGCEGATQVSEPASLVQVLLRTGCSDAGLLPSSSVRRDSVSTPQWVG